MRQLCRICNFLNHFCILVFMCCRPFQLILPFTALSLFICSLFLPFDVLFVLFILSLLVYLCLSIILYLFVLLLIFLSVFNSSDVMSSSYRPLLTVIFYLYINISGIYPILFLSLFFFCDIACFTVFFVLLALVYIVFLCFYIFRFAFLFLTHFKLSCLMFGLTVECLFCNIIFLSFLLLLVCQRTLKTLFFKGAINKTCITLSYQK